MPVSVLIKPASGCCNMACRYCFYREEVKNRKKENASRMSPEILEAAIRQAFEYSPEGACFIFQGGEPSLAGLDFFRLVLDFEKRYNRKGAPVLNCLQTNGLLLDDEWCGFLREADFLVGLSLDGLRESHDRNRITAAGEPTFDRVLETARRLEKHQVDFNILTVLNRNTAPLIRDIYRFYRANGWKYQQYLECLPPLGEDIPWKELALTPEEYGVCLDRLFQLWYEDLNKGRAPYIRQFENYVGILLGIEPEACNQRGRCSLQYVIETDGSVYPCDFYAADRFCLGNIRTSNFRQLAGSEKAGEFLRKPELPEDCGSCEYGLLCRGGCRRLRSIGPAASEKNYLCSGLKYFFDKNAEAIRSISRRLIQKT